MRVSEKISKKDFYRDQTVSDKTKALGVPELLFLIYILILPVETSDYLQFYVGFLRISVVDLLLLAVLYLLLIKRLTSKSKVSSLPTIFVFLFLLAILSSIVSFFYIPWNEYISYDVKMTLNLFEFLAVFYITTYLVRDINILNKILLTLCISLLALSVLTIFKSIGFDLPGFQRGAHPLQVGPFYIGIVALVSILPVSLLILGTFPIVMSSIVIKRLWIRIPLIVLYLVSALLTYSRSLWIALILEILLMIYYASIVKTSLTRKIFFTGVIPALLLLLYKYFNEIYLFFEGLRPETAHSRLSGYQLVADLVSSKIHFLLFGAGRGTFVQSYSWSFGKELVAHNFLLDILVSKGLITLLFMLSAIFVIIYDVFKIKKTGLLNTNSYSILFIISISGMIMEGMMTPISNSLMFWTYLALAYSFVLIVKRRIQSSRSYT